MSAPVLLPIASIVTAGRLRAADPARVAALAESIAEIGLQHPIHVHKTGADHHLIAGLHRLEASRSLGLVEIEAVVLDMDEADRHIWEIDENLMRSELGPADQAKFISERKRWYEVKHPETKQHVAGANAANAAMGRSIASANLSFASDTAKKTSTSVRTVQRAAARGHKINDGLLAAIAGTPWDTGEILDRIAKLDRHGQMKVWQRIAKGKPPFEPAVRRVEVAEEKLPRDRVSEFVGQIVKSCAPSEIQEIIDRLSEALIAEEAA